MTEGTGNAAPCIRVCFDAKPITRNGFPECHSIGMYPVGIVGLLQVLAPHHSAGVEDPPLPGGQGREIPYGHGHVLKASLLLVLPLNIPVNTVVAPGKHPGFADLHILISKYDITDFNLALPDLDFWLFR